jgi:hypothetical protein
LTATAVKRSSALGIPHNRKLKKVCKTANCVII